MRRLLVALLRRMHLLAPPRDPWEDLAAYVHLGSDVILGSAACVDVKYRPLSPGVCVEVGDESQLFGTLVVQRPGAKIRIGQRCQIGASHLIAADTIDVGDDVLMAWGVTVMDNDSHSLVWDDRKNDVAQCASDYASTPQDFARNKDWSRVPVAPITIGPRVWIGFGASILKGVTIGEGAVIGACTVVTKDVPPYSVVVGNPGRVVRQIGQGDSASTAQAVQGTAGL